MLFSSLNLGLKSLRDFIGYAQKSSESYKILRYFYHLLPDKLKLWLDPNNKKLFIDYTIDSRLKKDFYFVKIGANDGITGEPIYPWLKKYHGSGIFVEPMEEFFQQLQNNYKDYENVIFENVAISDFDGSRDFYYVDDPEKKLPDWSGELGSFDLNVILKHSKFGIPDIANYLASKQVTCLKLSSLLEKYQVKKIDFLSIDVEGYDYEIIKQINFQKLKPSMILYEHSHLTPDDQEACKKTLLHEGYQIIERGRDTFAY